MSRWLERGVAELRCRRGQGQYATIRAARRIRCQSDNVAVTCVHKFRRRQLLDEMETEVDAGGKIIDWHSCEIFPERWIDLVIVLRCDHTKLWERLEKRWGLH